MVKLFAHQEQVLEWAKPFSNLAACVKMGGGKTFIGSEKAMQFGNDVILVICQKSKINDWCNHFKEHYDFPVYDLSKKAQFEAFLTVSKGVGVINYESSFRREELLKLANYTLMLDESSMIQNDKAKRTKFILKLKALNKILLTGTPCSGKYENLYSQMKLMGYQETKKQFYDKYMLTNEMNFGKAYPIKVIVGYKNVDALKQELANLGFIFMDNEEMFALPAENDIDIAIPQTTAYRAFMKKRIVDIEETILVGDNSLKKLLYARQLCSIYNKQKLQAFEDLINSTEDRLIVFYNFKEEIERMLKVVGERPVSIVNGEVKDLSAYEAHSNSITFIQYQAGAMGLNLQKANTIIYYSLTLSSEMYQQSRARTRRIGQTRPCFYYHLLVDQSVEHKIFENLQKGMDYTNYLFDKEFENGS